MKPKQSNLETLSPSVSAARLRNVQKLLDDDGEGSKLDAILCILGVDGRYDEGCKELANYLLFGFYDTRHPEMDKIDFDEEAYEDLMILVKHGSVHVYCHPALYVRIIDYVSHWRNLRLHCLRLHQADFDEEMVEDFKIKSFVSMVQGCDHIGLPYTVKSLAHLQPFDKMVIEKWPIVQAYALDEITGGGFFTMKHQVTDIGCRVEQLYSVVDPVGLEMLITKHLPLFERQWTNFLEHLDVAIADKDFDNLTEDNVGEALFTYYKHGRVSEGDQWKREASRQPFVLFGDHASKSNLKELEKGSTSAVTFEKKADLKADSLMVCQCVSPKGPLCCGRTYSLTPLHIHTPRSGPGRAGDTQQEPSKDAQVFQVLYSALTEGVEEAMAVYSKSLSVKQAETAALSKFSEKSAVLTDDVHVVQKHIKKPGNVTLTIKGYDKDGSCRPLTEKVPCQLVKTVTMTVCDLPSVTSPGKTLGSVLFAESFLDSSISLKKADGTEWLDGEVLVLTADIPRLISWNAETDYVSGEQIDGDGWGEVLSPAEMVHTTACGTLVNIPLEGKLTIWERAMMYSHHQLGSIALDKEQVASLQLYDGDSPSKVAVLAVGITPAAHVFVPAPLTSLDKKILVAFFPKTKAYKNLFSVVLPSWKKETNFPNLERLEELPEEFLERYDQLERLCASASKGSQTVLERATVLHHNLKGFFSHLGVSSVCGKGVSDRDLPLVLGKPMDIGQFDNPQEILITIVSGLPGSHKENLCQVLTNFAKEQNRWISFKQPLDSASLFNPKALQQSLSSTLHMLRKKHSTTSNRQFSVLILTPGYTDVIDVVKAVTNHPDPNVKASYRIGAITCCVDPLAVYMENRLTFPIFLNHCAEGWVNNIVFTSCTSPQNPVLSEVQELIRSVNDNVAYILAENAQVTRSTDIDLILSHKAFGEDSMVRARSLLTPGWEMSEDFSSCGEPVIEEIILRFSQPLDRTKLVNKLKGLKLSNKGWSFTGNIYHFRGRTTFTSNVAKSFEMRFSVPSEKLDIHPVEATAIDGGNKNSSNFVVFSGCELKEEGLKNWLRTTARQVPAKKVVLTRKDLTKQILADIHSKNHLEELPEGWFYNGHTYISLTGEKSDQHPDMEDFIEKYITKKNEEIKLFNARVDENNIPDLFA